MKRSRYARKQRSFSSVLLFGAICNLSTFILLTLFSSFILSSLKNPLALMGISAFAVLSFTGGISGFLTARFKGENGATASVLTSLIIALLIFATGAIIAKGELKAAAPINLLSYLVFSLVFSLLAKKRKRYRRFR